MSDHLHLDNQLCFALYAASRAMTAAYAPVLEKLELTYPQYLAMLTLWEDDGIRVSRIGERLHLDSATLTPLLKRLEVRDLIERRRSGTDERVVEVFLTTAGRRMKRQAAEIPRCMLEKFDMSVAELVQLRGQVKELTEKLRAAQA
jgi:MarR family transcriptional regulator, organic hydroperoxide resistance regulator